MAKFKDNQNREWVVEITVATIKRVRSLLGVDLLQIAEGKLTDAILSDPVMLVDVLYAVCKPEAEAGGVSDEDFGRAMAGDAIDSATQALLEALASFFPSRRGELLRRVVAATNTALDKAVTLAEQRLSSGELERIAEAAATEALRPPTAGG
jgi:hypothetical protein